ncbi:MAG: type VI secretion system protein TssA, partial [Solimonas sp.]
MQRWAAPVTPDDRAGPNLEYDPLFGELERAAQGTPESVLGNTVKPAEEPRWSEVERLASGLLDRTRDLRVAAHLLRALLRSEGLPGLSRGVALIETLLTEFWDGVHPQLDADDDNDPTLRINSLVGLNDVATTLRWLREVPIVSAPRVGRYGLRDLRIAEGRLTPVGDAPRATSAEIDAAALEAPIEQLIANRDAAAAARATLGRIETLFAERAHGAGPDFTPLRGDLQEIERFLA